MDAQALFICIQIVPGECWVSSLIADCNVFVPSSRSYLIAFASQIYKSAINTTMISSKTMQRTAATSRPSRHFCAPPSHRSPLPSPAQAQALPFSARCVPIVARRSLVRAAATSAPTQVRYLHVPPRSTPDLPLTILMMMPLFIGCRADVHVRGRGGSSDGYDRQQLVFKQRGVPPRAHQQCIGCP